MRKYAIGDFSKHLCVTPDFLKYYEKKGILKPEVNETGYRFFHFWERGQVIECIKLRNCGFSSKEVVRLLNATSLEDYLSMIRPHQARLQTQLEQLQAQMQAFDSWSRLSPYFEAEANWEITNAAGFYFLPHSDYDSFSDDQQVHLAAQSWLPWMPIVQSAIRYNDINAVDLKRNMPVVGFTVPSAFAENHTIYLGEPVEYVAPKRWLVIYLKDQSTRPDSKLTQETGITRRDAHVRTARSIMQRHSLTACSEYYYIMKLLQLTENDMLTNYSVMQIPLK